MLVQGRSGRRSGVAVEGGGLGDYNHSRLYRSNSAAGWSANVTHTRTHARGHTHSRAEDQSIANDLAVLPITDVGEYLTSTCGTESRARAQGVSTPGRGVESVNVVVT